MVKIDENHLQTFSNNPTKFYPEIPTRLVRIKENAKKVTKKIANFVFEKSNAGRKWVKYK